MKMSEEKLELFKGTLDMLIFRSWRSGRFTATPLHNAFSTRKGRKQLQSEAENWEKLTGAAALILQTAE